MAFWQQLEFILKNQAYNLASFAVSVTFGKLGILVFNI